MIKFINGIEHVSGVDAENHFCTKSNAQFRRWRVAGMPFVRLNGKYWYPLKKCHKWFATTGNGKEHG